MDDDPVVGSPSASAGSASAVAGILRPPSADLALETTPEDDPMAAHMHLHVSPTRGEVHAHGRWHKYVKPRIGPGFQVRADAIPEVGEGLLPNATSSTTAAARSGGSSEQLSRKSSEASLQQQGGDQDGSGGGRRSSRRSSRSSSRSGSGRSTPTGNEREFFVTYVWFWTGWGKYTVEYSSSDQYLSTYMYMMGWNHRNMHCIHNAKQGTLTVHAGCLCIRILDADSGVSCEIDT